MCEDNVDGMSKTKNGTISSLKNSTGDNYLFAVVDAFALCSFYSRLEVSILKKKPSVLKIGILGALRLFATAPHY